MGRPPDQQKDKANGKANDNGKGACLGVLFVHGLGDAKKGETLAWAGEPLYTWLKDWLGKGKSEAVPKVFLNDTHLTRSSGSDLDAPSHSELYFQKKGRDRDVVESWILAESWWADTFPQASFSSLWKWGLGIAPWLIARTGPRLLGRMHDVLTQMREAKVLAIQTYYKDSNLVRNVLLGVNFVLSGIVSVVGWLILLLVGILMLGVGFLVQLLIFTLLLFAFIPKVRDMVQGIQQSLAGNLGDGYIIASSPMSLDAMVSQVHRDIDWLREKKGCKAIALIAHSGGAGVCYEALNHKRARPVDLLVTYGQGLSKLDAVRKILRGGGFRLTLATVLKVVAIVLVLVAAVLAFTGNQLDGLDPLLLFLVGAAVAVGTHFFAIGRVAPPELEIPGGTDWLDYYAVADPVPDGVLEFKRTGGMGKRESHSVDNLSSITQDHGQYWYNNEQFISQVAVALYAKGGFGDLAPGDDERDIDRAAARRHSRVFVYMATGLLSILVVPVLWFGLERWEWVQGVGKIIAGPLMSLLGVSDGGTSSFSASGIFYTIVGMAVVAMGVGAYKNVALFPFWRAWSTSETRAMHKRDITLSEKAPVVTYLLASLVMPALACFTVFAQTEPVERSNQMLEALLTQAFGATSGLDLAMIATWLEFGLLALAVFVLLCSAFLAVIGWVFVSVDPNILNEAREAVQERKRKRSRVPRRQRRPAPGI
jgi:hypothetical protein